MAKAATPPFERVKAPVTVPGTSYLRREGSGVIRITRSIAVNLYIEGPPTVRMYASKPWLYRTVMISHS